MTAYLFSIFTRGIIALSGFLVFLVTARLFGADGRGVIAYGTSLFASVGILISFNLGRVFLGITLQNEDLKRSTLPYFLFFNLALSLITMLSGCLYWYFSDTARSFLDIWQLLGFSFLSFFYIWFNNGPSFFSSFAQTKLQDTIVLGGRFLLLVFVLVFWATSSHNISLFVWGYSFILFAQSCVEILFLFSVSNADFRALSNVKQWRVILVKSWWPHLDYISFNIFPLMLMVLSAFYISKTELGRANFAIQIVNLIFLLSTTANVRITTYVAKVGIKQRISQFKKLFWFTLTASLIAILAIYFVLLKAISLHAFSTFTGVTDLFLISTLAIPGYLSYQFFNPIWIELNQIKKIAVLNTISAVLCFLLLPLMLSKWGPSGMMYLFAVFHLLVLSNNVVIYIWVVRRLKAEHLGV